MNLLLWFGKKRPHRCLCLSTLPLAGVALWGYGAFLGGVLLEEFHHRTLHFATLSLHSQCFLHVFGKVWPQLPAPVTCLPFAAMPSVKCSCSPVQITPFLESSAPTPCKRIILAGLAGCFHPLMRGGAILSPSPKYPVVPYHPITCNIALTARGLREGLVYTDWCLS